MIEEWKSQEMVQVPESTWVAELEFISPQEQGLYRGEMSEFFEGLELI